MSWVAVGSSHGESARDHAVSPHIRNAARNGYGTMSSTLHAVIILIKKAKILENVDMISEQRRIHSMNAMVSD